MRLPAKLVAEAAAEAAQAVADSLHQRVECGDLRPEVFWRVVEGLLFAAMRTLDAIYQLAAESQPKAFPAQAGVLIRTLLENLGNLLALSEAPEERLGLYARDAYRSVAEAYSWLRERHGSDPAWAGFFESYEHARPAEANAIGLSEAEVQKPESLPRWPTPGGLLGKGRGRPPFQLTGARAAVFGEIYDAWYSNLSMIAHQRLAGIEKGVVLDEPSPEERKKVASDVLTSASFFVACVATEIEWLARLAPTPKLRETWVYVKDRSHEMRIVYEMRYKGLLEEVEGAA